jgi:hypothetical protein
MAISGLWHRAIVQPALTEGDTGVPACPLCGNRGLIRIHRRPIDHLLSLFVNVYRFRCQQFECQWEGNLTKRHGLAGTRGARRESDGARGDAG